MLQTTKNISAISADLSCRKILQQQLCKNAYMRLSWYVSKIYFIQAVSIESVIIYQIFADRCGIR